MRLVSCITLATVLALSGSDLASGQPASVSTPKTVLMHGPTLVETRAIYLANKDKAPPSPSSPYKYDRTRAVLSSVKAILAEAENRYKSFPNKPLTIVDKRQSVLPKGATENDYVTYGVYFWERATAPCLTQPKYMTQREQSIKAYQTTDWVLTPFQEKQMPIEFNKNLDYDPSSSWINCDGVVNPQFNSAGGSDFTPDKERRIILARIVSNLGLAYWYTGEEKFAERIKKHIYSFFLDASTRMNPNLNYAQMIPDADIGRPEGIIDWAPLFIELIADPVQLLRAANSPSWTAADQTKFEGWMRQMLQWLKSSSLGKQENAMVNNHGPWFKHFAAGLAMHVGDNAYAQQMLDETAKDSIGRSQGPVGYFPFDALRTRSSHYQIFGFQPIVWNSMMGENTFGKSPIGNYKGPQGQSVRLATDWLMSIATGKTKFPFYDVDPGQVYLEALPTMWYAAIALKDRTIFDRFSSIKEFSPSDFEKLPNNLYTPLP